MQLHVVVSHLQPIIFIWSFIFFFFSNGTFHLNILIENWDHIFDDIRMFKGGSENWIQSDGDDVDDVDDEEDEENENKKIKKTEKMHSIPQLLAIDF